MTDTDPVARRHRHTGRRRNDAAREAILDAAMSLLANADGGPVTVDVLAREAGVGRQTIYRWWTSKGEVFLEALNRNARFEVPPTDTGALQDDLEQFLDATFRSAGKPATAGLLRTLAAEASGNPHIADLLRQFTSARRQALGSILQRGLERQELAPDADLDLMVDQVYGFLWYRLLLDHRPFPPGTARQLTRTLIAGNS